MTPPATPPATPPDDLVARWWADLPPSRRQQVRAADPLPRWAATDLWRAGVSCPLTLLDEHGRLVRRAMAPEALVRLLSEDVLP